MLREEPENTYVPSKYSKAYNNYSRSEIKSVIPILKSVARSCNIAFRYPVFKVLKAIAKIFLMNEIEAIFFAYMIKETAWDIRDRLITLNSEQVRDVVCCANEQPEYKNLILYLMLITYSLKFFLNEDSQPLLEQATRICPGFRAIFENWTKKHSNLTKRINPKTLNKVYQDLYLKIRHEESDYNLLVDSTLQISPAYNPEKDRQKKQKRDQIRKDELRKQQRQEEVKKEYRAQQLPRQYRSDQFRRQHRMIDLRRQFKDEVFPNEQPSKMVKMQARQGAQHNPIFSSSRLYEMVGVGTQLNVSGVSNFQVFGEMNKSGNIGTRFGNSVFGSSVVLKMPTNPVRDDEDNCQQLNLGLQEGESEQNINLRDPLPQAPPTSIIHLSRGISIHEQIRCEKSDNRQN